MDESTLRNGGAIVVDRPQPIPRPAGERHSIQSVDRAMTLLEAIAEAGGETTLTELSHRTKLNISTCHHLLSTLVPRGYVAKVPVRRSYALGARILFLSHACLQVDLPRRAEPFITRINEMTGETVHLAVLQGETMVALSKREARHPVRVDGGTVGKAASAHATATGKAMLAWLPEHEIRRIVSVHGMTKFTPHTITEFPGADRGPAPCAAQRLCARSRGIQSGRHLRRRRDPRSQRRGGGCDQRLGPDHAHHRRSSRADA